MDASNVAYQSSTGLVAMLLHPPRSTDPARAASSSRGPARSPAAPASSWLLSKTTGILSLSVSPESCRLKLAIKEYCLLDQDLAASAPALCLRLLSPAETGTASWLLLIQPQAGHGALMGADGVTRHLPSLCFRFNSGEAGLAFRSLLQAAGEADARYRHSLQAASEAAAFAAVAAVAAPAVLGSGAMPPAASEPSAPVDLQDSGGGEGHKTWQDSSGTQRLCPPNPELLKAQICACLLDPGFDVECSSTTDLVNAVENAWSELEQEVDAMQEDADAFA